MKPVICSFCEKPGHYKMNCFEYQKTRPRGRSTTIKPLKSRLPKYINPEDVETRRNWIQKHGGIHATWECYLRISPMCIRFLTTETLTIEHVIPKGKGKIYRHDITNLRPACAPCNGLKGSSSLEYLSQKYPHLKKYLGNKSDSLINQLQG